jgi:protein ImuB
MRRVVSLWLPTFSTDRWRQVEPALLPDAPLVLAQCDGNRQLVAAADKVARSLGLSPGLPLAEAQARVPGLVVRDADPEGDAVKLNKLAAQCLAYAPLVAPDPPDGIWVDATGCAQLHGGEEAMLRDMVARFACIGFAARGAIAATPGAAHAAARFGGQDIAVDPPIVDLPVAGLRLPEETIRSLCRLGFDRIEQLVATPRAPLVRRFGPMIALRLDQVLGRVFESITPIIPPELPQRRLAFVEPLLTAEAFSAVIARLVRSLCPRLERKGQGARQLDLLFERIDGSVQYVCVGTAQPSRNAQHLTRLLQERVEQIDPGLGVEAIHLIVSLAEPLTYVQTNTGLADDAADPDISTLIDCLTNRLGTDRVYRAAPVESDVPERATQRIPPLSSLVPRSWPANCPRPVRLFTPPQPVEAMALLPDQPPVAFTWRRVRHRVRRADGPERIAGEWWKRDAELWAVRDYFRVEDEAGRRYWLFRKGDGVNPATGDLRWFLHGVF